MEPFVVTIPSFGRRRRLSLPISRSTFYLGAVSENSKSYISRSALRSFLLDVARTHERGIAGLELEFADENLTTHGCNWTVVSVDNGTADPYRALCAVAKVQRANSGWVMVEDGSELDGLVVERPGVLH